MFNDDGYFLFSSWAALSMLVEGLTCTTSPWSLTLGVRRESGVGGGGEQAGAEEEEGRAESASLSALVSHGQGSMADQAHYKETLFPYGKMYENLKGQAVC